MNVANLSSFHEQPPLVFWLESLFFRIFGDSLYTERIYTFMMLLLNMLLLRNIWRLVLPERKDFYWLAILCWITIPVCFWSYANCMHENTMSVFCLSAIASACTYYFRNKKSMWWLVLSSVFIVLAFMSKGLPGLYPLALPFCLLITSQLSFKKMISGTLLLLLAPVLFTLFVIYNPIAHQSIIENYLIQRLFQRVGHAPTVTSRFDTLFRLASELIPALALIVVLYVLSVKQKIQTLFFTEKKKAFFFALLGFCGTLPLMLTSVQKGFYMVAALPCFGLAIGILLSPSVEALTSKFQSKTIKYLRLAAYSLLAISILLTVSMIGKTSRDKEVLHDVYAIKQAVPYNTYFEVANKHFEDWTFQNYLMRYDHLALRWKASNYLVIEKAHSQDSAQHWERIPVETLVYDFYKRK
jgi:4-amino-4-deoxy-L-arabinose transferase-like glycosyltransferase